MDDKELLICLVIGFANSLKLIDAESEDDNGEENDNLNRMSIAIEKMTVKVFGKKINMDFGMLHLINDDPKRVIQYITDYTEDE